METSTSRPHQLWMSRKTLIIIGVFLAVLWVSVTLMNAYDIQKVLISGLDVVVSLGVGWLMLRAAWTLRRLGSRLSWVWGLMGSALFLITVGNVLWQINDLLGHKTSFDLRVDIFYITAYLLFFVAGMLFPYKRESKFERIKTTIDIFIVMLAALVVYWNFILGPVFQFAAGKSPTYIMFAVIYPVIDLALFWMALVILYRLPRYPGRRPVWLLLAGVAINIFTDTVFSYQSLTLPGGNAEWVEVAYLLTYLILGLSAYWQDQQARSDQWTPPDLIRDGEPELQETTSAPSWVIFMPYIWVGVAYSILIFFDQYALPMSLFNLTVAVGAIIILVMLRQVITFKENQKLYADLENSHIQAKKQAQALEQANREMLNEIDERRKAEDRLSHDALYDSLTGLPNRVLVLDRVAQAMRKRKRIKDFNYALLFLDLDRFKVVNDSLGHTSGDQLLKQVAQILARTLRGTDTVARLGGDEFVILLEDINTPDDVVLTAERLQNELLHPLHLGKMYIYVTVSVGIVNDVAGYETAEDLLRDADLAMYQAKAQGKACYAIFDQRMRTNAISRLQIENDIRRALECHEFLLYYQPVISLTDNRLIGFEALARWQHPNRGLLGSPEFIPVTEETGLIIPLGKWVLFEACHQAAEWNRRFQHMGSLKMSVNVSSSQLHQPDFVKMVKQALRTSGLPKGCLVLEVTESVCIDNIERVSQMLKELEEAGVEIQIDDFGTGYSSLSYLQQLPVHTIKIDRTFIQPLTMGGISLDMVRGILSMAGDIGIKSVAEGIENQFQLEELNRLNCAYGQGFFLASPMDRANVERWLLNLKN